MAGVELATAYVSLVPTTRGVQASVTRELSGVPAQFEQTGRQAGGKFSAATKAAVVAGAGLAAGIAAIFHTGIGEQSDFLTGQAQLTAGLKSTGGAAGTTVAGMEALASTIQNYSGQTDDSIVSTEKLLLTFTNIKNVGPDKIFDQATAAAADMAAKMGGDASSSAIQLGKALNDPVKGITALTRVGVSFTDGQKKQIAALVKTGDTVGAQKIILGELNKEFGGSAKAAGETLPGQLARAKRSFEDVSQSVVAALMPALTAGADILTNDVLPAFSAVVGFLTSGSRTAKIAGTAVAALTVALLAGAAAAKVMAVWDGIMAVVKGQATAETGLQVVALVASKVATVAASAATKAYAAAQWLVNAAVSANPIALAVIALVALAAVFVVAYKKSATFRAIVHGALHAVSSAASTVIGFFTDTFLPVFTKTIPHDFTVMKNKAVSVFGAVVGFLKTWVPVALAVLVPFIGIPLLIATHLNRIKSVVSTAFSAALGKVRDYVGRIVDVVSSIPSRIAHVFGDMTRAGRDLITAFWDGIKGVASGAGDLAAGLVQAVKDGLNSALSLPFYIPTIRIGAFGKYVTIGGQELIPRLATGGMTTGPTQALIGDNRSGRELVMPMDSPATVGLLAAAIAKSGGDRAGAGNQFHIVQQPNQSGRELADLVASRVAFAARSR